jgi:hypothetical protein
MAKFILPGGDAAVNDDENCDYEHLPQMWKNYSKKTNYLLFPTTISASWT